MAKFGIKAAAMINVFSQSIRFLNFNMLRFLAILAILPAVILAGRVPVNICRDGGPIPSWAAVEGCDMEQCHIRNGEYVELSGQLIAQHAANSLETLMNVRFTILGIDYTIDFELPDDVRNGCNAFPNNCPIFLGNDYTLRTSFGLDTPLIVRDVDAIIEFSFVNELNEVIMCVSTPVTITN